MSESWRKASLVSIRFRVLAGVVALCCLLLAAGCGESSWQEGDRTGGGGDDTLTVFAASSLTDAFRELEKTFEKRHPGVDVRQSFESSSTLLTQIQQGAPADVFASAAQEEMDAAVKDDLVSEEPRIFVRNREVVMVPEDNPANIMDFRDLATPGIKLVLAEDGVPAADYALEILGKSEAEYGDDFEEDVLSNVVSWEADVRASVNRVALGDADATFGYASDYTPDTRDRVKVIQIPPDLNIVASYPIATLKEAENPELARNWTNLVTSKEGQRVMETWNFEPAS